MALPYPNMEFTPLDILTAKEMNQLVANDKYLGDSCSSLWNCADNIMAGNNLKTFEAQQLAMGYGVKMDFYKTATKIVQVSAWAYTDTLTSSFYGRPLSEILPEQLWPAKKTSIYFFADGYGKYARWGLETNGHMDLSLYGDGWNGQQIILGQTCYIAANNKF